MGACWSSEDSDYVERRQRRAYEYDRSRMIFVNTTIVQDGGQIIGVHRPCYGEYKCPRCGRFWSSTLSWRNSYLVCKRCNTHVYPKNQREVRPSDNKRRDGKSPEHSRDLCEKCKQLGHYCANYNKAYEKICFLIENEGKAENIIWNEMEQLQAPCRLLQFRITQDFNSRLIDHSSMIHYYARPWDTAIAGWPSVTDRHVLASGSEFCGQCGLHLLEDVKSYWKYINV